MQETVDRPDGYAFRSPGEVFDDLAGIIGLERRCGSFLRFTLPPEPRDGPVRLEITGPPEAKEFVANLWG